MTIPLLLTYGSTPEEARKAAANSNYEREYQADLKLWRNYTACAFPVFDLSPRMHYYYMRSLLVLKLLMYDGSGAILAAPTTSFPEIVGEDKNWDYRFCWVRDGAYSAEALALAGLFGDSRQIIDFLLSIVQPEGKPYPHPLVSIYGDLTGTEEEEIDTLAGFGNSRPVRIGNKAVGQKQNDLEGEVVHAIYTLNRYSGCGGYIEEHFPAIGRIVDYVAGHWREKDAGIWEFRRPYMDYVHSKTMCWAPSSTAPAWRPSPAGGISPVSGAWRRKRSRSTSSRTAGPKSGSVSSAPMRMTRMTHRCLLSRS